MPTISNSGIAIPRILKYLGNCKNAVHIIIIYHLQKQNQASTNSTNTRNSVSDNF